MQNSLAGSNHVVVRDNDKRLPSTSESLFCRKRSTKLTGDFAEPGSFVLEESDLNLGNVGDVGIQDKLEIHMAHHARLRQHQLKHVLVPARAAQGHSVD